MDLAESLACFNRAHAENVVSVARELGGFDCVLSGELNMQSSNDLAPLLDAALEDCGPGSRLVLDLSRVTYVASMGVGLLSTLMVKAERKSVTLVLLDVPPRVQKILEVLGLLAFFRIERSDGGRGPA
jgi:anti-anti-sigma factor